MPGFLRDSFSLHKRVKTHKHISLLVRMRTPDAFVHIPLHLFLLVFLLSSCDLFSTRTPASPYLGSTFIWISADTPQGLLKDFKVTAEVLDAANYMNFLIISKDSTVTV